MLGEVVDALPLVVLVGLLLPDEDLAVVTGRGEDVTVLWVSPSNAPNGAFVSMGDGDVLIIDLKFVWFARLRPETAVSCLRLTP